VTNPRPTFDAAAFRPEEEQHRRRLAEFADRANAGKINVVTQITLAAGVTVTTITDPRIGFFSCIDLTPETANAAAAIPTTFIPRATFAKGSAVINHANAATLDRSFTVKIFG